MKNNCVGGLGKVIFSSTISTAISSFCIIFLYWNFLVSWNNTLYFSFVFINACWINNKLIQIKQFVLFSYYPWFKFLLSIILLSKFCCTFYPRLFFFSYSCHVFTLRILYCKICYSFKFYFLSEFLSACLSRKSKVKVHVLCSVSVDACQKEDFIFPVLEKIRSSSPLLDFCRCYYA